MKDTKKVLGYIWLQLKSYKIHVALGFLLWGIASVIGVAIVPLYIKKLTDVLNLGDYQNAFTIMWILVIVILIERLAYFFTLHVLSYVESHTSKKLDSFSFSFFARHSYDFYTNEFTGSLVDKMKRLGVNVVSIIDTIIFDFFGMFISIIAIFIVLFRENIRIGFTFLIFLFFYSIIVKWAAGKMAPIFEERSRQKTKFSATISDIFTNIQTILFFSSYDKEQEEFEKQNLLFHKKRYKSWREAINYNDSIGFLPILFTISITFYGVYLSSLGLLSTGSIVLIFLVGMKFYGEVWRINRAMKMFTSNISDCVESIEVIEKEVLVKDINKPLRFNPLSGEILINNTSFIYPGGDRVFEKFNLHIKNKQSIGIVGKSGSGKTTITKLILRLYDINQGQITIDNQNIAHISQHDLRSNIAYIPQDTILFHRTIYENITYGNLNASREDVLAVAKSAHVDEFVQELELGYETKVGERGIKLSGGQRQRIGIARAMLKKDAPILIMDEATSSLDTLSEQYIQDSFEKLSKNRTTIVIAHRLSTIQKMDRIIVMDKGEIIEDGSHNTLLKKNGHYAELWNSQINGFIQE